MKDPRSGRPWRRLRLRILERDGYRCHWCGATAQQVDHVRPLSRGGAAMDPRNLVAACTACNQRRNTLDTIQRAGARRRWRGAIDP